LRVADGNAQPEMQRGGKNGGEKVGVGSFLGTAICLRHPASSHPQLDPAGLTVPTQGRLSPLCPASPRGNGLYWGMVTNHGHGTVLHLPGEMASAGEW